MKVGRPSATCNFGFPADLARPRSLQIRLRATLAADHHSGMMPSASSPASSTMGEVSEPRYIGTGYAEGRCGRWVTGPSPRSQLATAVVYWRNAAIGDGISMPSARLTG